MSAQRRPATREEPVPSSSKGRSRPALRPGRRRARFSVLPALALLLAAFGTLAAAPAQAAVTEVWSATLTVKALADSDFGCINTATTTANKCSTTATLSDNSFDAGGETFTVSRVELDGGTLHLTLDKTANGDLTILFLCVGTTAFYLGDTATSASVSWTNSGLTWAASNSISLKVASACAAPAAVTDLSVTQGVRKLDLSWTAPARDQVTGYDVQYQTEELFDAVTWVDAGQSLGAFASYELTGLTPLTLYYVRVRAVNDAGDGDWSPPSAARGYPLPEPHGPIMTPNFDLLISLKFNDGVRDLAIRPTGAGDLTGLGGPEYKYYVYLPPGVESVTVTPTWLSDGPVRGMNVFVDHLSVSPREGSQLINWQRDDNGTGKSVRVMPSSRPYPFHGMTELRFQVTRSNDQAWYTVYLQHHNGWKSANDRLNALTLELD